jgi:phenylalanine ammonia-lyase
MRALLDDSTMMREKADEIHHVHTEGELIQDRYNIRAYPQFAGPIADGFREICGQLTVEMNSATDNPVIDASRRVRKNSEKKTFRTTSSFLPLRECFM